ncbi:MAG: pilus assembly protein TadG-related protein [Solirubrobacteraceae bacterium]
MRKTLRTTLGKNAAGQSGQSLILTALAMLAMFAMSALVIDISTWYVQRHRDQVVADAAALAAANCLANPSSHSGLGPSCTSATDTADAQAVAVAYAAANGLTLTTSQVSVNTSTDTVTVNATASSTPYFARLLGINTVTTSASSQAAWQNGSSSSGSTTTCTGGDNCYAIYAANQTCGPNNGWVTNETSEVIDGAVHSQGSLNISNGSFTFNGPVTYSSGNCPYTAHQNATISSGGTHYLPAAGWNQAASYWPENYADIYPACGGNGTYQCTGPSGTPSYCTAADPSFSFTWANTPNGVYCAYGTGTPSDPSTWNGTISFTNGAGSTCSSSSPYDVTMIAGNVYASGASALYLQPYANNLLVYATDTDAQAEASSGESYAVAWTNGPYHLNGIMFAPNGSEDLSSVSITATFLEAQNVYTINLSDVIRGEGPMTTSTGATSSSTTGSDSLVQ